MDHGGNITNSHNFLIVNADKGTDPLSQKRANHASTPRCPNLYIIDV